MAEFGEELHPQGSRGGPGLMADLKAHKTEVIIGGAAILVTILLYLRSQGKSAAPAAPAAGATPGNLQTQGSTSVSTDMLASAMQTLTDQQTQALQGLQTQLASSQQTALAQLQSQQQSSIAALSSQEQGAIAGLTSQLNALAGQVQSIGSSGQTYGGGGGNYTAGSGQTYTGGGSSTSSGYGNTSSNPPVVQNNSGPPPPWGHVWLTQNQSAWDSFINGGAVQGAGISPAWAALYVAQNQAIPNTIDQWNNFLNAQGIRNPQTGALSGAAGQPPSASLQQQIRNAFGFGLGFSNT